MRIDEIRRIHAEHPTAVYRDRRGRSVVVTDIQVRPIRNLSGVEPQYRTRVAVRPATQAQARGTFVDGGQLVAVTDYDEETYAARAQADFEARRAHSNLVQDRRARIARGLMKLGVEVDTCRVTTSAGAPEQQRVQIEVRDAERFLRWIEQTIELVESE